MWMARFLCVVLVLSGIGVVNRNAQAQTGLLPPARVERERPLQPWAAAAVPGLLTLGGVIGSASMRDADAGFWLATVSVWLLPSVGNVALGSYRTAGMWWALRTLSLGMMLPGALAMRDVWYVNGFTSGRVMAYFVTGCLGLAVSLVGDILSAHAYATELRHLSVAPVHGERGRVGPALVWSMRF